MSEGYPGVPPPTWAASTRVPRGDRPSTGLSSTDQRCHPVKTSPLPLVPSPSAPSASDIPSPPALPRRRLRLAVRSPLIPHSPGTAALSALPRGECFPTPEAGPSNLSTTIATSNVASHIHAPVPPPPPPPPHRPRNHRARVPSAPRLTFPRGLDREGGRRGGGEEGEGQATPDKQAGVPRDCVTLGAYLTHPQPPPPSRH